MQKLCVFRGMTPAPSPRPSHQADPSHAHPAVDPCSPSPTPSTSCCWSGRRCAAALRHVRAVTATYRMTTRPPPSRPSHYAAGVLAPLRAFLDAAHGRALPAATRARLAQAHPL